jgi:hypothetical protein
MLIYERVDLTYYFSRFSHRETVDEKGFAGTPIGREKSGERVVVALKPMLGRFIKDG